MKLISDNSGINREIRGVRIIVAPNMENFLGGGELLLTSLPAYEKLDDHMMVSHLNELNKKQISGFIVKRKQNTAHLNKLFETLVCFCEEHNIPVLELPQDISYWLVIKYVLSQICSNIVVAKFIYSKLTRDEISQYFAGRAIREKAIEKLICGLETMLGNPVALYDAQFHNMYSSTSEPIELKILKDSPKYVPNIITQLEYIRQKRNNVEYIKEIDILGQSKYYLLISEINEPLMELDFITLEGAVSALLYFLIRIIAHHVIRLAINMHFKLTATVYLNFILSIYSHQRNFTEHFKSRIGFRIRIILYTIRHFVYFCLYQRFLRYHLHSFQHFSRFCYQDLTQINILTIGRYREFLLYRRLSYRSKMNEISPRHGKPFVKPAVRSCHSQFHRLCRIILQ